MPKREWKGLLVEIVLALALVAICAPGLIWWVGTIITVLTGARPW
ncbi:hypothetical protein ACLBKU_16910 [Erythrobacter sp. NE805]